MNKMLSFLLIITTLLVTSGGVTAETTTSNQRPVKVAHVIKKTTYIKSLKIKQSKLFANFDYIQWYTGKRADQEFLKDCKEECKGKDAPHYAFDGYYIRNANPKIRTLLISNKAIFVVQPLTSAGDVQFNKIVTKQEFIKYFYSKSYYNQAPFHIEIKNGVVTKLTQQYIP
ncbi:hypothetical protein J5Y03_19250 [Bacillus sp. RG28]|uniref:Uncharacterized protein n=1 Tax=Gottfriedia endophytica TaxID=2820819 RepID=A0A940NY93_9BACI|nr:hypothetical protein [Gottfriedia endophytica]MBP0727288.1 hypothetical protein [Gottfriedia endophytica]